MNTQLEQYAQAHDGTVVVRGKAFTLKSVVGEGEPALAEFVTQKASYTGVLSVKRGITGAPDAELWSIVGGTRTLAFFAVAKGAIVPLRQAGRQ